MTKEPEESLYWTTSPPLAVEPFRAPSPLRDTEALEVSLSWGERAKWEEQEEAARAATTAAIPPVSSAFGRGAAESPAGPVDHRPIIIDFPNPGITYNGGWCSATMTR